MEKHENKIEEWGEDVRFFGSWGGVKGGRLSGGMRYQE